LIKSSTARVAQPMVSLDSNDYQNRQKLRRRNFMNQPLQQAKTGKASSLIMINIVYQIPTIKSLYIFANTCNLMRADRPGWLYLLAMTQWIDTVKSAIAKGREHYELAARTIVDAMAANRELTQRAVASQIGRSRSWVSRLLDWHRAGCQSETVFGPESAARRAAKRIALTGSGGSTSENGPVYQKGRLLRDGRYWQARLPLGDDIVNGDQEVTVQRPSGEEQATVRVLGITDAVSALTKTLSRPEVVSREMLGMTYASLGPAKKRAMLASLAEQLEKLAPLAQDTLSETRAALKCIPRTLDDGPEEKAGALSRSRAGSKRMAA